MRKIKFRVWNKSLKKFEDLSNFWVRPDNFSTCFMEWCPDFDGEMVFETEKTDFIYQQYTGLKDKDNREIYEGDIVFAQHDSFDFHAKDKKRVEQHIGVIGFHHSYFSIGDYKLFVMNDESLEIRGNIFENPELLNQNE